MRAVIKATIVATAAGTGAWLFGLSGTMWPSHPMVATFVITVVTYAVARRLWPQARSSRTAGAPAAPRGGNPSAGR